MPRLLCGRSPPRLAKCGKFGLQHGFSVNDGQSLLTAAINGLGIAYLPSFLYADAMKAGLVEDVIPDLPRDVQGLHAVYPSGRYTQPKVRALIDFLVEKFGTRNADGW